MRRPVQAAQTTPVRWWKAVFWLAVVTTAVVLLVPGDRVLAAKVWVASWLPFAQVLDQANFTDHSDKWVHLGLFTLLGTLAARIWWGLGVFKTAVLWLTLLAVGTECLQHFIPGRGASAADLMADVAGLTIGSLLWRALRRWGQPRSARAVDF